jgi:hypothetical protein
MSDREFTLRAGVREQVPLLVGISGPSGSGKTYSALEMATGMQEAVGGPIIFIDTENRRALHYADVFKFEHLDMGAPFGSLDYLAALRFAADQKPAAIIVDSMSHEHEGPGGMVDYHARELHRMAGDDYKKQERMTMLAWQKPKQARRALLNGLVRLNSNVIMCFRAGEKSKPGKDANGKTAIIEQGFTPIAGPEFVYEMTLSALLYPGARGVPTWESDKPGEHGATKMPGWASEMFAPGRALTRAHGRALAEWAKGGAPAGERGPSLDEDALRAEGDQAAALGTSFLSAFWKRLSAAERKAMLPYKDQEGGWKEIAAQMDAQGRAAATLESSEIPF